MHVATPMRMSASDRRLHADLPEHLSIIGPRRSPRRSIHPGYGFLAENGTREIGERMSVTFIGRTPEAIRLMGDNPSARNGEESGVHPSGSEGR